VAERGSSGGCDVEREWKGGEGEGGEGEGEGGEGEGEGEGGGQEVLLYRTPRLQIGEGAEDALRAAAREERGCKH
jgi:hypothetical protein